MVCAARSPHSTDGRLAEHAGGMGGLHVEAAGFSRYQSGAAAVSEDQRPTRRRGHESPSLAPRALILSAARNNTDVPPSADKSALPPAPAWRTLLRRSAPGGGPASRPSRSPPS